MGAKIEGEEGCVFFGPNTIDYQEFNGCDPVSIKPGEKICCALKGGIDFPVTSDDVTTQVDFLPRWLPKEIRFFGDVEMLEAPQSIIFRLRGASKMTVMQNGIERLIITNVPRSFDLVEEVLNQPGLEGSFR